MLILLTCAKETETDKSRLTVEKIQRDDTGVLESTLPWCEYVFRTLIGDWELRGFFFENFFFFWTARILEHL